MIAAATLLDCLRNEGVRFFTGVPDSVLAPLCACLGELPASEHVIAANEGSAVALAIGDHLATARTPLVYLQNAGLGNAINPLVSLASPEVFAIPMLVLVGWRGEPGATDEPQHRHQGRITLALLEACCAAVVVLDADAAAAQEQLRMAVALARERGAPVAIVVRRGTLAKSTAADADSGNGEGVGDSGTEQPSGQAGQSRTRRENESTTLMTREEVIARIVNFVAADARTHEDGVVQAIGGHNRHDLFVATTGMAGRELFERREVRPAAHAQDFLCIGGMGHASQIALALALRHPHRRVWCLDGDGAALMHLGGLSSIAVLAPPNLVHVILNNGAHDSVGGQPTVAQKVDLRGVAAALGYRRTQRIADAIALEAALRDCTATGGPVLLDVFLRCGHRCDLGRPTLTPQEQKQLLMQASGACP